MPWHTIATMIIVNMCVQCLFNLNFAHVTHINFFFKIKSLSLLLSFLFFFPLMYIRVYIWIMYVCMYVCVCACVVVVVPYWNIFQWSQVWFLFHESPQKLAFYHATKKDPRNPCLYIYICIYERRSKNLLLLFFFSICFSALDSSLSYLGDYCTPISF